MLDTLFRVNAQSRYPYWVNMPPRVPHFPNKEDIMRKYPPGRYTLRTGRKSHQNWLDKWYDFEQPVPRRDELPKGPHERFVGWFPWQFQPGVSAIPKWTKEGLDWPEIKNCQRRGKPTTELMREKAKYRCQEQPPNFYSNSNYMTSTYRHPVFSIDGPLQRDKCYGLTHQHKRHGFMTFEDYY